VYAAVIGFGQFLFLYRRFLSRCAHSTVYKCTVLFVHTAFVERSHSFACWMKLHVPGGQHINKTRQSSASALFVISVLDTALSDMLISLRASQTSAVG
jgi:hypothetical protein